VLTIWASVGVLLHLLAVDHFATGWALEPQTFGDIDVTPGRRDALPGVGRWFLKLGHRSSPKQVPG
jgi:hypothetical protein